jgi:sugar diacid utilization regulator
VKAHAGRSTAPGTEPQLPGDDGFTWLLDVVHELAHEHAGNDAACLFVPAENTPAHDVCGAMSRDTSALLLAALQDAGVDVVEQLEPVRLYFPGIAGREHVLVLPLSWRGTTHGVLVISAPTPPVGRAGLTRVRDLATMGLGLVFSARERSERLLLSDSRGDRLTEELAESRLFLDLQETLLGARTTAEVVEHLATWLDAPVAVQMPNLIVAEAAGPGARELALSAERSPLEHAIVSSTITRGQLPLIPAIGRGSARIVAPVIGNSGEFAGFLLAGVGVRGAETTRRALTLSRGLIAYQMSVRQDIEQSVATLRQTLLIDLLANRFSDDLAGQAAKLGHDLAAIHVPITVGTATGVPLGRSAARLMRLVEQTCNQASSATFASLTGVVDDMVVAFVPEPLPAGEAALARAVQSEAATEGFDVVVGIGQLCTGATDMPAMAAQARWSVQVLRTADGRSGARTAHFDDLGVYGVLFDHHRADDLKSFAQRWLGPLLEYDRGRDSELVETLRQLFRQRSLANAAAELHIHISTLKYRVARIEEILGISVQTWDNVFHLELALRIHAVADQLHARG